MRQRRYLRRGRGDAICGHSWRRSVIPPWTRPGCWRHWYVQLQLEVCCRLLGVTNACARERSEVPVRNPGFFTCRELPARHDDG